MEPKNSLPFSKEPTKSEALCNISQEVFFYDDEMLARRPTPKLKDNPLSVGRDCLFDIFVATLHIWRPYPPSTTRGRAVPW